LTLKRFFSVKGLRNPFKSVGLEVVTVDIHPTTASTSCAFEVIATARCQQQHSHLDVS
jgi:hypothetical protein